MTLSRASVTDFAISWLSAMRLPDKIALCPYASSGPRALAVGVPDSDLPSTYRFVVRSQVWSGYMCALPLELRIQALRICPTYSPTIVSVSQPSLVCTQRER